MKIRKVKLGFKIKTPVLAFGGQTKNTLCFTQGDTAYISPVHPDLSNPKDFSSFKKDAEFFLKKNPKIIAYDLHPEYQSTKFAQNLNAKRYTLYAIQHHHAHIASCMAENGLSNQRVIGVAFDGTGLGTDNKIWGAEFLLCDYKNFQRKAHLKEIPLFGGEKAILNPRRLALAWLGEKILRKEERKEWQLFQKMRARGVNAPLASSMGRLFDAAASLILRKDKAGFEAELAIELEKLGAGVRSQGSGYNFKIVRGENSYIIDPLLMFREIVKDLKAKKKSQDVVYRFHLTVAEMVRKTCVILRKESGIKKVVLSGGVFQNNLLLRMSLDLLYKEGFKVFVHRHLSCNDMFISLGEAVVATHNS